MPTWYFSLNSWIIQYCQIHRNFNFPSISPIRFWNTNTGSLISNSFRYPFDVDSQMVYVGAGSVPTAIYYVVVPPQAPIVAPILSASTPFHWVIPSPIVVGFAHGIPFAWHPLIRKPTKTVWVVCLFYNSSGMHIMRRAASCPSPSDSHLLSLSKLSIWSY